MNTHKFNRQVAIVSILAGMLALASIYLTAVGSNFDMAVFANPMLLLGMTTADAGLLKASMIADMFGYYLLLLPALGYFHNYLKSRTGWSFLISWCGSAYILIGAIGAAILAVTWPAQIVEYPIATALQREIINRNFGLLQQVVYEGLWNTLEVFLASIWWMGIGWVVKKDRPLFGSLSIVLGIACLIDGVGTMTGLAAMAEIGLSLYIILGIVWPVWFGIGLLIRNQKATITPHNVPAQSKMELA